MCTTVTVIFEMPGYKMNSHKEPCMEMIHTKIKAADLSKAATTPAEKCDEEKAV